MTTDSSFRMAVRTGNWGVSVMLPFHKRVRVHLPRKVLDALAARLGYSTPA